MQADGTTDQLESQGLGRRRVVAQFDAGRTSSDGGGALLLREVEARTGWLQWFGACFRDGRLATRTEHTVAELVAQCVLGIALGYEDLIDHETLRDDPLLALAAGKKDVMGAERVRERDRGDALADKSTLNRLEHDRGTATRYRRIDHEGDAIERYFSDCFLEAHAEPPARIVLDLDATDDPLHGHQEGRSFHGYYGNYCYLPLYIFGGDHLLVAQLRTANQDASAGAVDELARVVGQIRTRWPAVEIWIRAESGLARESLMAWCEANAIDYVLGLAKNARLRLAIGGAMAEAQAGHDATQAPARRYEELRYRTRKSWSRERRVVGKGQWLPGKTNPRFVVTSLPIEAYGWKTL